MNARQWRENERNINSNNFLTENQSDFAGNAVAVAKINALKQKVVKTQTQFQEQLASTANARQDYSDVDDAFDALLAEMRSIRDFTRSMAQDIAGLDDKFRLPPGSSKRKYIAAARASLADAEHYKEQFIDYGMDADFIDELRAKADHLETALAEAESSTGDRVGATSLLGSEVSEATRIVDSLDPIVRRTYRAQPAKLAAWIHASHVRHDSEKPSADRKKPADDEK